MQMGVYQTTLWERYSGIVFHQVLTSGPPPPELLSTVTERVFPQTDAKERGSLLHVGKVRPVPETSSNTRQFTLSLRVALQ